MLVEGDRRSPGRSDACGGQGGGQAVDGRPRAAFSDSSSRRAVLGRQFGRLLGGQFKRVISKPDWSAEIGDAAATGGPAVDLHIHDTHFIGLIAGVPKAVFASGTIENGVVTHLTTNYLYGSSGPAVACSSGAIAMKARPFVHGFELYLEKATLVYESGTCPLTVLHADWHTEQPALGSGDPVEAFTTEIQTAADGVTAGKMPDLLEAEVNWPATLVMCKECESVSDRTGCNDGIRRSRIHEHVVPLRPVLPCYIGVTFVIDHPPARPRPVPNQRLVS